LSPNLPETFQQFKNLGFTIKYYQDISQALALEEANILKGYISIINTYHPRLTDTGSHPYELFFDYYGNPPSRKPSASVTRHINHLLTLFALMGKGQMNKSGAIAEVRFLVVGGKNGGRI
jgi:hypothetical protein